MAVLATLHSIGQSWPIGAIDFLQTQEGEPIELSRLSFSMSPMLFVADCT